jgi:hypothetical protein
MLMACLLGMGLLVGAQTPPPIALGDPQSGEIAARDEVDTYVYSGQAGEALLISVTASGESLLDSQVEIYDPNGDLLGLNDDNPDDPPNAQLSVILPIEGDYEIRVSAFGGVTTGAYTLEVSAGSAETPAATPGPSESQVGAIFYGETLEGLIQGDQTLTYTFEGDEGDYIAAAATSEGDTLITILDAEGGVVATDDDSGLGLNPFVRALVLPASQTYTLSLYAYPDVTQSDFTLSLFELAATEAPLDYGEVAEGEIGENEIALFRFSGAADELIQASASTSFDSYLRLYTAERELIAEDDDSGGNSQALLEGIALPADGEYLLELSGFDFGEFGEYQLSLNLAGEVPTTPQGQALAYGETVNSNLTAGEQASFLFQAAAGDVISITVEAEFDSLLELYLGDTLISTDDDSGVGLNPFLENIPLADSGDYEIRLLSFTGGGGSFTLTLSSDNATATPPPTQTDAGTSISYGQEVSGTLEPGQTQSYSFEGQTGEVVSAGVVAQIDTYLELRGPDGNLVASDDDSGEGLNPLVSDLSLPATGTYTLVVGAFVQSEEGDFTLRLDQGTPAETPDTPPVATGQAIQLGQVVTGDLAVGTGETLSFSLAGQAGQVISVGAMAEDWFGDLDLFLEVYSPSGELLAEDDDRGWIFNPNIIGLTLPDTGDYTLVVSSFDGQTGGTFSLVALEGDTAISPSMEAVSPLILDTPVEVLLGPNETRVYEFAGQAEQELTLRYQVSGDGGMGIYDLDSELEEPIDPDLDYALLIPSDDRYFLIVYAIGETTVNFQASLSGGEIPTPDTPVATETPAPVVEVTPEAPSQSQAGLLLADTPRRANVQRNQIQTWVFSPFLEGSYNFILNSEDPAGEFDPYLRILDVEGNVLAEDDDSGGNFNALVSGLALTANQTVLVEVRSFADQKGGDYFLIVVSQGGAAEPAIITGGAVLPGFPVENTLVQLRQQAEYTLILDKDGAYDFSLTGLKLPYLDIYDSTGTLIARGAGGLTAQELAAGQYRVVIFDRLNRTGSFRLEVSESSK